MTGFRHPRSVYWIEERTDPPSPWDGQTEFIFAAPFTTDEVSLLAKGKVPSTIKAAAALMLETAKRGYPVSQRKRT